MNTPPPAGLRLTADNPWPGLQSFDEAASGFFFGREAETETLFRLVRREALTVFYGQSGLGKTSLLQAGLFPKLREANLIPLRVRLDYTPGAPSPASQVKAAVAGILREQKLDAPLPGEAESLWEYFHRGDVDFWDAQNRLVTLVIIFDQFEERFTLGRQDASVNAAAEAFLTGLSELLGNRPPPELQARFEARPGDVAAFDFQKQSCKVVFSLREDFLPELEGLRDRFPAILQNRFRLLPMNQAQAREVVLKPGARLVGETVAAAIVEYAAGSRQHLPDGEVEPALLSLILQGLNARRLQRGQAEITADLLSGDKEKILDDFYEESVRGLPERTRLFIEDRLLTSSGYRDSMALEDAKKEFGLEEKTLAALINCHLIRREERLGVTRLELVHDLLTSVVARSRRLRLEKERWEKEREQDWRLRNDRAIRLAARVNSAAEDWSRDQKTKSSVLLRGILLCQAAELLDQHPELLPGESREFITESQRRRRSGRLLWSIIALAVLALVIWNALLPVNQAERVPLFLRTLFLFVVPCLLPVLDRWPKRASSATYVSSAWRWTLFSWGVFLIASHYLNPNDFGQAALGALAVGIILLVPVFKWRAFLETLRQSLQPMTRVPRTAKTALFITAALLPTVLVFSRTSPALFKEGSASFTNFETNSAGWIVRTVTTPAKPAGKLVETTYFQPGAAPEGYYKTVIRRDLRGRPIELAYLDATGQSATNRAGVQRCLITYNSKGERAQQLGFGPNGRQFPTRDAVAITQVLPDGPGHKIGLQIGDVVWSYADWNLSQQPQAVDLTKPIADLIARIKQPGAQPRKLVILRDGAPLTFEVPPGLMRVFFADQPVPETWFTANRP